MRKVRHKVRGTLYTVLGEAKVQVSKYGGSDFPATARLLSDMDKVIVYQGEDGQLWVRLPDEFNDGRFEDVR